MSRQPEGAAFWPGGVRMAALMGGGRGSFQAASLED